jgi:hypothetical protein
MDMSRLRNEDNGGLDDGQKGISGGASTQFSLIASSFNNIATK